MQKNSVLELWSGLFCSLLLLQFSMHLGFSRMFSRKEKLLRIWIVVTKVVDFS